MGKVKFSVRVDDKGINIDANDTGEKILTYLAVIAVRAISNISVEHEKALRGLLCDMIMSVPTNGDNNG